MNLMPEIQDLCVKLGRMLREGPDQASRLMSFSMGSTMEDFHKEVRETAQSLNRRLVKNFNLDDSAPNRDAVRAVASIDPFVSAFVTAYDANLMGWEEAMNRLVVALSGDRMMIVEKLSDAVVRTPVAVVAKK